MLSGDVTDANIERALNEFVQRSLGMPASVAVEYRAGVALVSGEIATKSECQAIEDLLLWHDGVTEVVNRLVVAPKVSRTGAVL